MLKIVFAVIVATLVPLSAWGQECGPLSPRGQYGPFDYRTQRDKLEIVEIAHFSPDVENLRTGDSGYVGSDIDYTLRASPNHHRALMSIMNLGLRTHTEKPKGARYSVECYFERGVRFAPDDGIVRMIHGVYLGRIGKKQEALAEYKEAERLEPANVNLQYNMGLLYFDFKQFDLALRYAQQAYRNGAMLPGLKSKLVAAKLWQEPPPDGTDSTSDSAAPNSSAK